MSKLGQLLSYLDREDVTRLQFTAGKAVMLHTTSRAHPVTVTPLTESQIRKFFNGTDVADRIPKHKSPASTHRVELLKANYEVEIEKQSALMIEVRPGPPNAAPRPRRREPSPEPGSGGAPTRKETPIPGSLQPLSPDELSGGAPTRKETSIPGSLDAERPTRGGGRRVDLPTGKAPRFDRPPPSSEREPAAPTPIKREPSSTPRHSDAEVGRAMRPTRQDASVKILLPGDGDAAPSPVRREPSAQISATASDISGVDPRTAQAATEKLTALLRNARGSGASDVHIVSEQAPRVRVAGRLQSQGDPTPHTTVAGMLKPLLQLRHHEQLTARGYTDLAVDVEGCGRLRVNACRQRTGLKVCFRLVVDAPPKPEDLGMPEEVKKLTTHHQGLVIISGPNGHGKTTSMSALVDMFNATKPLHIITVEDPVEVMHPVKKAIVTQREVGSHTKTFESALAGALREDPDVIAIGELRDRETVEMALQASETGHLVLATMSTASGAKTIDRVIDMFPPDDQAQVRATLAGALKLVISQRLLRRADGRGMVAAFEMITGNIPLWTLIRDSKLFQLPSLLQRGRAYGMIKLEDSLKDLIRKGEVENDEAMLYADDKKAMSRP